MTDPLDRPVCPACGHAPLNWHQYPPKKAEQRGAPGHWFCDECDGDFAYADVVCQKCEGYIEDEGCPECGK